jgi:preprotein translocase SecE subunit
MARHRQRARDRKSGQQPLHRENVSGELNHASGEVDEVEASIVAGANGDPTDLDEEALAAAATGEDLEGGDDLAPGAVAQAEPARAPAGPRPGGNRLGNFLRASWAELQRVQWPDRRQVGQATAVVLGFVAIAGAYLGIADAVAQKIVDFIL